MRGVVAASLGCGSVSQTTVKWNALMMVFCRFNLLTQSRSFLDPLDAASARKSSSLGQPLEEPFDLLSKHSAEGHRNPDFIKAVPLGLLGQSQFPLV